MENSHRVNRIGYLCILWLLICSLGLILAATPAAAQEDLDVKVAADPGIMVTGGTVNLVVTVTYLREPVRNAVVQITSSAPDTSLTVSSDRTDGRGRVMAVLMGGWSVAGTIQVTADAVLQSESITARLEPLRGQGVIDIPVQRQQEPEPEPVNMKPFAVVSWNGAPGPAPYIATISGQASYDPDGSIAEYRWDLGDGELGSGDVVTHTYENPGSYTVSLIVIDRAGIPSAPEYAMVQVTEPVTVQPRPDPIHPGLPDRDIFDSDNDGIRDTEDNCPGVWNPDQLDREMTSFQLLPYESKGVRIGDGIGDACDNCGSVASSDNGDSDGDCEPLKQDPSYWDDTKGWLKDPHCGNPCDLCPGQVDSIDENRDGTPDCLQDGDKDLVPDFRDNCPHVSNPDQKETTDRDGLGDACDFCPGKDDRINADGDDVPDCYDNCPGKKNPAYDHDSLTGKALQADNDHDGVGDACDCDDGRKGPDEQGIDCGGPCTPCGKIKISGTLVYQDENKSGSFWKPVRFSPFQLQIGIYNSELKDIMTLRTYDKVTDGRGWFLFTIPRDKVGEVAVLKLGTESWYSMNYAVVMTRDLDNCNEYVWWNTPAIQIPETGDMELGELKIGKDQNINFRGYWGENSFWCGHDHNPMDGGSAYFNIADAILTTRLYADGKRADRDNIAQVDAQWPDPGCGDSSCYNDYWSEINLADYDGFNDGVIAHEYGHHLENTISVLAGGGGSHEICTWEKGPVFAWKEGFSDYLEAIVPNNNRLPGPSQMKESDYDGWIEKADCSPIDLNDPVNRYISLLIGTPSGQYREGIVAAVLWDLADANAKTPTFPNSVNEPFDTISGKEKEIFGIFDYEFDNEIIFQRTPGKSDLCKFVKGWEGKRLSLSSQDRLALTKILSNYGVVCP